MLMPKRVKYRKAQRGRMKGKATRGATIAFGDFGLKAMEPAKYGFGFFQINRLRRSQRKLVWEAARVRRNFG